MVQGSGIDPRTVSIETGRATSLGRAIGLGDADVAVKIRGQELDSLVKVADQVLLRIRDLPRIADARIDLQLTQPELEIEVNRAAAARYGLSVTQVADAIEAYLRGVRDGPAVYRVLGEDRHPGSPAGRREAGAG